MKKFAEIGSRKNKLVTQKTGYFALISSCKTHLYLIYSCKTHLYLDQIKGHNEVTFKSSFSICFFTEES